eukprot:CAMPEP_0182892808 /NCGR_PEP_ID=MMETSP0034_2-20130328/24093_1 /TAXON_ID=156128 /ORGANISM="Nephroselmis pyriformis, Strain CCMP717" /LENGTH=597 /DNA_ID=CAMNT_0025026517 /DNA_START=78 /DNA_END=1868 /DNA_ORIENTATION=+
MASGSPAPGGGESWGAFLGTPPVLAPFALAAMQECNIPDPTPHGGPAAFGAYMGSNPAGIPQFITSILAKAGTASAPPSSGAASEPLCVALNWIAWAFCGGQPDKMLDEALRGSEGQSGTCGLVWGRDDIAYRCKTCEMDPTCAICVNCFLGGDHEGHDYAMIRTGGGCCDCGDPTAWKPAGFCKEHAGPKEALPLPVNFLATAEPALGALLGEWKRQLSEVDRSRQPSLSAQVERTHVDQLTSAMSEWLLHFCGISNTLLRLIAMHAGSEQLRLLEVLMQNDGLLSTGVAKTVHSLLYKLLGDPHFKHQFATTFVRLYPSVLESQVRVDVAGLMGGGNSILDSFSVQIFTVPALVPRLAKEAELLDVLLGTLSGVLKDAMGGDSVLQAESKALEHRHYWRVSDDLRYVLSHVEAAHWMTWERPHLLGMWLRLLHGVQGMTPHTRLTSAHVEMESDAWSHGYLLETQLVAIHPLLVAGILHDPAAAARGGEQLGSPSRRQGDVSFLKDMGMRAGAEPWGSEGAVRGEVPFQAPPVQVPALQAGTRGVFGASLPGPFKDMLVTCLDSLTAWLATDFKRYSDKVALKRASSEAMEGEDT